MSISRLFIILFVTTVALTSCIKEEVSRGKTTELITTSNPLSPNFTLFNFTNDTSTETDGITQSDDWDFGLKFTTMIINGGEGRVGEGGVQLLDKSFDEVNQAPESGYKTDTSTDFAIKDEWYTYNSTTRTFAPIAGKTFVIKTGKGRYAKMEILSALPVDDNGVLVTGSTRPTKIKYRFRYQINLNDSRDFN